MAPLFFLLILVALWLSFLALEAALLDRRRRAVSLRIAVTGTRGKTSVTRNLAAVLREDGRTVLAKSTGSEATYVLPDGTQEEVRRLGAPSVIEQKRLLRLAKKLGSDTVVAEIMSLHADNHQVEAQRILRPQLVLVTNFRVDHVEAQGTTPETVASVLALDVPPGATALLPEAEWELVFAERVARAGGSVERVPSGTAPAPDGHGQFASNLDLVWAAARILGVGEETIRRGLERARGDLGALRIWRYPGRAQREAEAVGRAGALPWPEPWLLVNAFAANDPESTLRVYDEVRGGLGVDGRPCVGLLSLRADRGDRTLQWIEALEQGFLARFRRLYVLGLHARALKHRLGRVPGVEKVEVLAASHPRRMMERITSGAGLGEGEGGLLFGFGNIGGLGERMVRYWNKTGEPHGI